MSTLKITDLGGAGENLCLYLVVSELLKRRGIQVSAHTLKNFVVNDADFRDLQGRGNPGDAASLLVLSRRYRMIFVVVDANTGEILGQGTDYAQVYDHSFLEGSCSYWDVAYLAYRPGHFMVVDFESAPIIQSRWITFYQEPDSTSDWVLNLNSDSFYWG